MVLPPGKMYRPTDVAVDVATNSVYVVEQFNHRISKWNYSTGTYVFTSTGIWGSNNDNTTGNPGPIGDGGPTDTSLYRPTGIVFDGTRLVVTDTFHNRIRTINPITGEFIDSVGQGGTGATDFYHPTGIATNAVDLIVIADEFNHRAVRYNIGDTPTFDGILPDPTPLGFNRPHGAMHDKSGTFFFDVTDTFHGVISRYNNGADGFFGQFGTPGTTGTDLFFPGSGHGILTGGTSVVFADTRNNILKTVDTSTITNTTGTVLGTGSGQLYHPESVVSFVDSATNYVLAVNTMNNRIEAYSNTGIALTFQSNFGAP
jgi:hypothetical protein